MLRGSLAALVVLWLTPGTVVGQHCLEPRVVAGEAEMVFANLGSSTVIWLEIDRDNVGTEPARVYVLGRSAPPDSLSHARYEVPVEGRAVVRVHVGPRKRVWLSPIGVAAPASSGGATTSTTSAAEPRPALRYRLCFRE